MDLYHLPDPPAYLPARWQPYAAWLAAQVCPPESCREHPLVAAQEWPVLEKDFEKYLGLPLDQYIRLKRVAHLLRQRRPEYRAELSAATLQTPLGQMLAVFSDQGLCLLEFPERKMTESILRAVQKAFQANFVWRTTEAGLELQRELNLYFAGRLKKFSTPLDLVGTPFQRAVWRGLQGIPYGETRSYKAQAELIGKPSAVRAVAAANGQNKISILIPCHRVIGSDGKLVGYGGGIARKQALLALESGQSRRECA